MVHLPYRLLTDYLVTKTENGGYDCLLSVAPPQNKEFLASVRIRNEEAGDKLFNHLEHIMALAVESCKNNSDEQNPHSSCNHYKFNLEMNTLLPN